MVWGADQRHLVFTQGNDGERVIARRPFDQRQIELIVDVYKRQLLSIVQMPGGIPVATTAIGKAGAKNAAILAAQMIGLADPAVMQKVIDFKKAQAEKVLANSYLDK